MLSTLSHSLEHCFEYSQYWFSYLLNYLTGIVVNLLIVFKFLSAPQTPQSKHTFPAVVNQENYAIDGPRLDSHHIQIPFPKVFVSADLHLRLFDHLEPSVIVLSMFDYFVRREKSVSGIKCSCWLLDFSKLIAFRL